MKKRIFALFMCTVIMLSVMPAVAITDDEADNEVIYSGEYGENISWQLTEDGKLIISGEGPMEEYYDYNDNPWREFTYLELNDIVINEGITKIGAGVFTDVQWYSNVYIPASVTEIDTSNFWYTRLYGGFWVDEDNPNYSNDEDGNLYNKEQTKLLQASDSFYHIFIVPANVTEIERSAFFGCEFLDKFIVEEGNEHFSTDAKGVLYDKDKTRVVCIPDGMTGVVTIPDSVTEFEWAMVRNSTELEAIVFEGDAPEFMDLCKEPAVVYYPENNETWTDKIFEDESVTWISYDPADPVYGPYGEFGDGLTWELKEGVLTISGEGEVPYNESPWEDYTSAIRHVVYEEGITGIANGEQFRFCENLISISVPASVTFLDYERSLGIFAFYGLMSLDRIIVAEDNPNYCSDENGNLYSKDKSVLYKHVSGVDDCYVIPEYVTTIFDEAFVYENLVEVRVHENVETIGMYAFSSCSNLARFVVDENNEYYCSDKNGVLFSKDMKWLEFVPSKVADTIIIPASVKNIAYNAFIGVTYDVDIRFEGDAIESYGGLYDNTIYYPENNPTWTLGIMDMYGDNTWIGYIPDEPVITAYGKCGDNLIWQLTNGGTLVISGEGDMWDYDFEDPFCEDHADDIIAVVISEGVTSVGDYSFRWYENLASVTLSNTVKRIGLSSFCGCDKLKNIVIPASVTKISDYAFRYSDYLMFDVDESNEYYSSDDNGVLYDKEKTVMLLTPITLSGDFVIPESVITLEFGVFDDCEELTSITIPASVKNIETGFQVHGSIKEFKVHEDNEYYSSDENGHLYNKDKTVLIRAANSFEDELIIPDGVEIIRYFSINGFDRLTRIVIPESVKSIEYSAIVNCDLIEEIIVSDDNKYYSSDICGVLFNKDKTTLVYIPVGLTGEYTIPATVNWLEDLVLNSIHRLDRLIFAGDAPGFRFMSLSPITSYWYPANNPTWTESVKERFNPYREWVEYDPAARPVGDVTGDCLITNADLVTVARFIVGLDNLTVVKQRGDMNGDGMVNNTDLVTIARNIVGIN